MHEKIKESEYGGSRNNAHIVRTDKSYSITLTYPPRRASEKSEASRFVEIDQESVRASDGIRVMYDYERDGWSIQQPQKLWWDAADIECDELWTESAFVRSWERELSDPDKPDRARLRPLYLYAMATTLVRDHPTDDGCKQLHTSLLTGWFQRARQAKAYVRRMHKAGMLADWEMLPLQCTRVHNVRPFQPVEMTR